MLRATRSVTIARAPGDVFAVLADPANDPTWRPSVVDIAHVAGAGVGATYRQGVRGPGGRRVSADIEITAADPARRLAFCTTTGPVRPVGSYDLAPAGDGTTVTFTLEASLHGLKRLLLGRSVQRAMESEVANLERLKAALEPS